MIFTFNASYLEELFLRHLQHMGEVKFTQREIDVLVCVCHTRGSKKIASLLSISPRTVETHIRNILLKIGGNSREDIIDFIKKAGCEGEVNHYYQLCSMQGEFEQTIRYCARLGRCAYDGYFLEAQGGMKDAFHLFLENFFQILGMRSVTKEETTKSTLKVRRCKKSSLDGESRDFTAFFLEDSEDQDVLEEPFFKAHSEKTLAESCLFLLKTLYPKAEIDPLKGASIEVPKKLVEKRHGIKKVKEKRPFPLKLFLSLGIFVCFVVGYYSTSFNNKSVISNVTTAHTVNWYFPRSKELETLIDYVHRIQKSKEDNPVLLILGLGGSGKTTLAKMCRNHLNASLVWTFKASSLEELILSYILFAQEVVRGKEEQQKALERILDMSDKKKQVKALVGLVHRSLKKHTWLLIFDGVNVDMKTLQEFFPLNPREYGEGVILLTSRNSNIKNSSYIDHTLELGSVDIDESYKLFISIRSYQEKISKQKEEDIKGFLRKIPPFPLDIMLAAHYLRLTNMPLETYIKRINDFSFQFDSLQKDLLSHVSPCEHTRREIIALSLEEIMKENKDFEDLLFMTSMLGPSHIPLELLYCYKDPITVDQFLYSMNSYSFLKMQTVNNPGIFSTSLHLSTMENIRAYFKAKLTKEEYEGKAAHCIQVFTSYMADAFYTDKAIILNTILIQHANLILEKNPFLKSRLKGDLLFRMGLTSRLLGNFERASSQLIQSIEIYKKLNSYDKLVHAMGYLGCLYGEKGFYQRAKNLLAESIHISKKFKTKKLPIKNNIYMGDALVHLGCHKEAFEFFNEAVKLAKHSGDQGQLVMATVRLARYYAKIGEDKKAIRLFNWCREYYEQRNIAYRVARVNTLLAQSYYHQGNVGKAKELFESALRYYEKGNDKLRIALISNKLALLCITLEEYDRAQKLLESSILLNKKYGVLKEVTKSEAYLGYLNLKLARYKKAEGLILKSLAFEKKHYGNQYIGTIFLEFLLGVLYSRQGNHEKGIAIQEEFLKKILDLYGEAHHMYGRSLGEVAYSYYLAEDLEKAEAYARQALPILVKEGASDVFKTYETLGYIYYKQWHREKNNVSYQQAKEAFASALKWAEKYFPKGYVPPARYPL